MVESIPVLSQTKWQQNYSTFANFDTLVDTFTLIGPDQEMAFNLYFFMKEHGIKKQEEILSRFTAD